jgi:tetratricopeptide (TPR) repeat protein
MTALTVSGCAAALVPDTPEPEKKVANAYFLMDQGRSIPARKLLLEALAIYEASKDDVSIAQTRTALGDLYKDGRAQGDFKLPDYLQAIENYRVAVGIYKKVDKPKFAALNLWAIGWSYEKIKDLKQACSSYMASRSEYLKSSAPKEATESFEKANFLSLAVVEHILKELNCR